MKKLLSDGVTNAKTKKNLRPTKILYMYPDKIDGKEMCPYASKGCRMSCLFTAGRGNFPNVKQARLERTKFYVNHRQEFYDQLQKEIVAFARKKGEVAVRLNGTSDQPLVETLIIAQMRRIPNNVVFYDYTKNHKKAGVRILPSGHKYVVTFSYSENSSETQIVEMLNKGSHVAVVFDEIPKTWRGYPVVDGDERDDLMIDLKEPTIIGLKAKGSARKDTSGFVIKTKELV